MNSRERQILRLLRDLDAPAQEQLFAFAEFLLARGKTQNSPEEIVEPSMVAPVAGESVVGAIKRLRQSYAMLEAKQLLGDTANLMSRHAVGGAPAEEVIAELEALFVRHYARYRESRSE